MKKELTHEEKLEFYKNFYKQDFQEKYSNFDKVTRKSFFATIFTLPIIAMFLTLINPWLALTFIPAFSIPLSISAYETHKREKLIKEINKDFSFNNICEMLENGEWAKLGYELSAKEMNFNHYAKNSKLIVEEKAANTDNNKTENKQNNPRSLNVCIFDDNENNKTL